MNGADLTIVMYHYVRPIADSGHPRIKGLELDLFRAQLEYMRRHYNPVSVEELLASGRSGNPIPPRSILLTFDDGFSEHHEHAAPLLRSFGFSGAFYPPSCAVLDRRALEVHKIHYILASTGTPSHLVEKMEALILNAPAEQGLLPLAEYRERHWRSSRFDPAEVIYVKRMLQHELPAPLRSEVCDALFREYVSSDPADFADSLYLDLDQLREMVDWGMHVGSHGHDHVWLEHLDREGQKADIEWSLTMLKQIGVGTDWSFCYPYGSYNQQTLDTLTELGCVLAFTTRVALAQLHEGPPWLTLPRLDTNDLPKDAYARPNRWTQQALEAQG